MHCLSCYSNLAPIQCMTYPCVGQQGGQLAGLTMHGKALSLTYELHLPAYPHFQQGCDATKPALRLHLPIQ